MSSNDKNTENVFPVEWQTVGKNGRALKDTAVNTKGMMEGGGLCGKRQRLSSGGTSKLTSANSYDRFKSMQTDEKLDCIFACLQDMKLGMQKVEMFDESIREIRATATQTLDRVKLLEYRSLDIEARQRRNNLIFWGIAEAVNEIPLQSVQTLLSEKLDLNADEVFIQRAHRLGYRRRGRGFKVQQRPLIVAFRDYQDVEIIISNAYKLAGSQYGINRDYPPEIVKASKELYPQMKSIKKSYPKAKVSIQFPAKLVVDGHVEQDLFPDWQEVLRGSRHVPKQSLHVHRQSLSVIRGNASPKQQVHHVPRNVDSTDHMSEASDLIGNDTPSESGSENASLTYADAAAKPPNTPTSPVKSDFARVSPFPDIPPGSYMRNEQGQIYPIPGEGHPDHKVPDTN